MSMMDVLRLGRADLPRVTDVIADAFRDYPVMRFILGGSGPEHEAAHRRLVGMFAMARILRNEPLLGIESGEASAGGARAGGAPAGGELAAAALVSFPDGPPAPPEFETLRDQVWAEVGPEARARYEAFGAAWSAAMVEVPHIHLNMIGVRRAFQGRGLARRLLDHVHGLARSTPGSQGVTLTTETPANVKLYEHLGYRVVRRVRVAPELESWAMFRPNDPHSVKSFT
jgi:ribosomal protein S18 acetylase RimI-like enzyme